jgi:hypothetical protein
MAMTSARLNLNCSAGLAFASPPNPNKKACEAPKLRSFGARFFATRSPPSFSSPVSSSLFLLALRFRFLSRSRAM